MSAPASETACSIASEEGAASGSQGIVHVVAPSSSVRAELARAAFERGYHAEIYTDYEELLAAAPKRGVIIAEDDTERGGVVALLAAMASKAVWVPVIVIATTCEVRRVVAAVKEGAFDYLPTPVDLGHVLETVDRAASDTDATMVVRREVVEARGKLDTLRPRELEVLDLMVAGLSNKEIGRTLAISPRTVEIHRANMISKLGANHSSEAIRWRIVAGLSGFRISGSADRTAAG